LNRYERFNNLKNKKPDVKTILSAGGWANVSTMLKTEDTRKAFIDSSIEVARKFGFDGLELHFLYQGCPDSLPEDKLHLTSLVKVREIVALHIALIAFSSIVNCIVLYLYIYIALLAVHTNQKRFQCERPREKRAVLREQKEAL